MNHKVGSVQELHDLARELLNVGVTGGSEASGDTIIGELGDSIESLKNNWKGKDAGVQINSVIGVYNEMVKLRNALAKLSSASSAAAVDYRRRQLANLAPNLEPLKILEIDEKPLKEEYSDDRDTIDINVEAASAKSKLDRAYASLDEFRNFVTSKKNAIFSNWTEGEGRNQAEEAFKAFDDKYNEYKETLSAVSKNIGTALQNYDIS